MRTKSPLATALAGSVALTLAACGSGGSTDSATSTSETPGDEVSIAVTFPASLPVIGDGYPETGDACRKLGESEATVDWLDDSATLVGCPTKEDARALGGKLVGVIEGITLVSIPMGDANVGMVETMAMEAPVKQAAAKPLKDPIRSPGGMETKCLAKVNEMTGGNVIGTRRIEEAESGVMIYVNVKGAEAPWQCFGSRDGELGDVFYGGDEGAL